jgi:hypothetical protein
MTTEETKTNSHDKHIFAGDGSPITVGGGGGKDEDEDRAMTESNVSCKFEDEDFPEEGNPEHDRKKFRHKNGGKIKTFKIRTGGSWEDHSELLPDNGDCLIAITCEGDNDDVIINGNKFGINMNPDTYKNLGKGVHENPDVNSYISHVVLNSAGQLKNFGPFSADDNCAVCTDFVAPDKSKCPS